jgi:hypothetical protein
MKTRSETFKHPQIFADTLTLFEIYYPIHNGMPKPFRYTVSEKLMDELAISMKNIILANAVDKKTKTGLTKGSSLGAASACFYGSGKRVCIGCLETHLFTK